MSTRTETIELIGSQQLLVERSATDNVLKLIGQDGQLRLSICLTADGPVLRFEGPGLMVESSGALDITASHIGIHGREGVAITSGRDANICAVGELHLEGRVQNISARGGNININADDEARLVGKVLHIEGQQGAQFQSAGEIGVRAEGDLRLDGERMFINCDPDFGRIPNHDNGR